MEGLDFKAAVAECETWAKYLRTELHVPKIGVTGFCMGGALCLASASTLSSSGLVSAVAPFYGIPDLNTFPVSSIKCPVSLHFGAKDAHKGFSDPATVHNLVAALQKHGVQYHLETYQDAGHAFMNEDNKPMYHAVSAAKAFPLVVAFFKKTLA
jgi:carboxymethylenebutenolidase